MNKTEDLQKKQVEENYEQYVGTFDDNGELEYPKNNNYKRQSFVMLNHCDEELSHLPIKKGRKGSRFEKQWSPDEIDLLINLWSEKGLLYDSKHEDYADKNKKLAAMEEIANAISTSSDNVLKKMNSLRTYYNKVRQSFVASQQKYGSQSEIVSTPNWPYYEPLSFLNYASNARVLKQTCNNNNIDETSSDDLTNNIMLTDNRKELKDTPQNHRSEFNARCETMREKVHTSTSHCLSTSKSEDEIFGDLIIASIGKIPDGEIKDELKISMQQLILQARRKTMSF